MEFYPSSLIKIGEKEGEMGNKRSVTIGPKHYQILKWRTSTRVDRKPIKHPIQTPPETFHPNQSQSLPRAAVYDFRFTVAGETVDQNWPRNRCFNHRNPLIFPSVIYKRIYFFQI